MSARETQHGRSDGERSLDERLLDDADRSPDGMETAAEEAFVEDQRENPDHPTRRQRSMDREHDVENPAHSQGI